MKYSTAQCKELSSCKVQMTRRSAKHSVHSPMCGKPQHWRNSDMLPNENNTETHTFTIPESGTLTYSLRCPPQNAVIVATNSNNDLFPMWPDCPKIWVGSVVLVVLWCYCCVIVLLRCESSSDKQNKHQHHLHLPPAGPGDAGARMMVNN